MADGSIQALLGDPNFLSFLVSYGASVAWDATKLAAGFLKPRGDEGELEARFDALAADAQLTRHAQHLITQIAQSSSIDANKFASGDVAILVSTVGQFLDDTRGGGAPLSEQLNVRAKELGLVTGTMDDQAISRFVASIIVALASGPLGPSIQLATSEKTLRVVQSIQRSFAKVPSQLQQLGLAVQDLRNVTPTSGSAQRAQVTTMADGVVAQSDSIQLALTLFGSPPANLTAIEVDTVLAPPLLPDFHVVRDSVRAGINSRLAQQPVLAITGYPACGKTSALADYITSTECQAIWISLPSDVSGAADAAYIISFALRLRLDAASLSKSDLQQALERAVDIAPLVVVIDNAERLGDPKAVAFLTDTAVRLGGRLAILFAYGEYPDFTISAQLALIPTWRLPGMTGDEAVALFERLGVVMDANRRAMAKLVCAQCDGHIGMLLLCRTLIATSQSAAGLGQLLSVHQTDPVRGFFDSLVQQLLRSLGPDEIQLCQRLSIIFDRFSSELASALWQDRCDPARFPSAWATCRAGVFELAGDQRFRLPYLYRSGLRRDIPRADLLRWNNLAAEHLLAPKNRILSVEDAYYCVLHRLAAERFEEAVKDALFFVGAAFHRKYKEVLLYLNDRYSCVLVDAVLDAHVSLPLRIRWAAVRLLVSEFLKDGDEQRERLERLLLLLEAARTSGLEVPEVTMAWMQVMSRAAQDGNIALTWRAFDALPIRVIRDLPDEVPMSLAFLVFTAYHNRHANLAQFVAGLLDRYEAGAISKEVLWEGHRLYELWRAVGEWAYNGFAEIWSTDQDTARAEVAKYEGLVSKAEQLNLPEIAVCLSAALVLVRIDVFRDLSGAVERAVKLSITGSLASPVKVYALYVKGEAFRCNGQFGLAIECYEASLSASQAIPVSDRVQTVLSLAVAQSRLGKPDTGLQTIGEAITLLQHDKGQISLALRTRVLLEAAAIAVAGKQNEDVLTFLISVHALLDKKHRNRREWPVLAQIAMAMQSVAKGGETDLPLPIPGFTFGLPDEIAGADQMLPCAPTIALGHACAAIGHHKQALDYYEQCFHEVPNDAMRFLQSCVMLPSVVALRDLRYATVVAARVFTIPAPSVLNDTPVPFEAVRRDFVLSQAVSIAVETLDKDNARAAFDEVFGILQEFAAGEGFELQLLSESVDGIRKAVFEDTDTVLADAYRRAVQLQAYAVARDLAWVWCHRHFVRRPKPIGTIVLWQWRLAWLSMRTLSTDLDNLRRANSNQRVFWERIDSAQPSELAKEILSTFSDAEMAPCDLALAVVNSLSRVAYENIGFAQYFPELGETLRAGIDGEWIDYIRQRSVVQLLTFVLSPAAKDIAATLSSSLDALAEALAHVDAQIEPRIRDWREEVDAIRCIYLHLVEEAKPNEQLTKALLRVRTFIEDVEIESGANWFFAYSRCLDEVGNNSEDTIKAQIEHLSSHVIETFVERAAGLSEHNRARLILLGLDVDVREAFTVFSRTLAIRCHQERSQVPIPTSAIEKASADYSQAKGRVDAVLEKYLTLEESLKGEEYAEERLTCIFQRGSLRAGYGGTRTRALLEKNEAGREQVKIALEELKVALGLAEQMGDNARSALIAGRIAMAAASIADYETAKQYVQTARSFGGGSDEPLLEQFLASVENEWASGKGWKAPSVYDDAQIPRIAEQLLEAFGWPEDRLANVEDDLRKLSRADEVKRSYCRHLQPIQNLAHTRSPRTIYTRPTQHTCQCLRFGHQTVIEQEDIEVVINAMQRTYCDDCGFREPGAG